MTHAEVAEPQAAHAELARNLYSQRTFSVERLLTRFNEMSLSDLSSRIIAMSRMLDILQRPRNGAERQEQGRLRSYLRSRGFASVEAAITRMQIERRQMFQSLAERVNADNASEVGEPESATVTSLTRIMDRIASDADLTNETDEDIANYVYGMAFMQGPMMQLRTFLTGPGTVLETEVGGAPVVHEGTRPPPLDLQPLHLGDFTVIPFGRERYVSFPADVTVGRQTEQMFRVGDADPQVAARETMTQLADAISWLNNTKRDWDNPHELDGNAEAQQIARDLAAFIRERISRAHSVTDLGAYRDGMTALSEGRLEEGLTHLRSIDELDPIFEELENIVIIRPNPVAFEAYSIGARMAFSLDRNSDATLRRWLEGGETNRTAIARELDFTFRAVWSNVSGTAQQARLEGEESLRFVPEGQPTRWEGTATTLEGGMGISWANRIFGRPWIFRLGTRVGYTRVGDSGDIVIDLPGDAGQRTIPGEDVQAEMIYIGTTGLEVELPRMRDEPNRIFRVVNFGTHFTRPLTVDVTEGADEDSVATGSPDFLGYITVSIPSIRHEQWDFNLYVTAGIGMVAQFSGAAPFDPGVAVIGRVSPTTRYAWSEQGWVEWTGPDFTVSHYGGQDEAFGESTAVTTIALGTGARAQVVRGLELYARLG
ncbi:TPA: hypothetical protein EYP38_05310, partial [Candidatus Micrarchaeota archaeon]|nr:hypothetical protein [Candidatus Micrarchaeota archaeon]